MIKENGNISIDTENIFPIIKRWLYSDKDIFIRELISNGCDAISKLKRLVSIGEAAVEENPEFEVRVKLNKNNKTIKFTDNGIGMTAEEVKKYINQVAFSGAEDFIAKYKDKMDEQNEIIGHFGLGFYSAFMVSDYVEIDTLSYVEDAEGVYWKCSGGTEYEIDSSELKNRGTIVTLHINEENSEFLDEYKLREVIHKHCQFLPVEIYVEDELKEKDKDDEKVKEEPLNDIHPLWMKNPKDCTDEEYKEFYRKVFNDYNEPLFWIHLNVDYPFNLKGILYFPKLRHELDASQGQVKLYNNQVFVADNIKEIVPEFLLLLKGVIDCYDLPLNVSRSFLQQNAEVNKLSRHIVNKVADKLTSLFNNERDKYNNFWEDINIFIKYGCMRDDKFYEKVKDILIYKTINNEYVTLKQYLEKNKNKQDKKVFYVTDEKQQAQYINMFKENNLDAVVLNSVIDSHFISFLEVNEEGVKFNRIDSDINENLKDSSAAENKDINAETVTGAFKAALGKEKLKVNIEALKSQGLPAMILLPEYSRRAQEMRSFIQGMDINSMFQDEETLILNSNSSLIKDISKLSQDESKKELTEMICRQIYDLALLSNKQPDAETMTAFIERSNKILELVTKEA